MGPTPTPKCPPSQSDNKILYIYLPTNYVIEMKPRKKMNPDQNWNEFLCKIFCWRSPINWYGNSCIKFIKSQFIIKEFLTKVNPNQFLWEFLYKIYKITIYNKGIPH